MDLCLNEQINQCSFCQHIGRSNDHLYYVRRTRRFLPREDFPRRLWAGGDMRNGCPGIWRWNRHGFRPRSRMQNRTRQIPRRWMDYLPWEIAWFGSNRARAIGINRNRVGREACGRLGVGVVNGVEHGLNLLEAQTRYENANAGNRRHVVRESKFCRQTRAGFAPAIKIPRKIAGNKVLCDQSS
jgi:hypothetical protein